MDLCCTSSRGTSRRVYCNMVPQHSYLLPYINIISLLAGESILGLRPKTITGLLENSFK